MVHIRLISHKMQSCFNGRIRFYVSRFSLENIFSKYLRRKWQEHLTAALLLFFAYVFGIPEYNKPASGFGK